MENKATRIFFTKKVTQTGLVFCQVPATLAVSLSAAATNNARNAIFGYAGTADMYCRLFQSIRLSVRCVEEHYVYEIEFNPE